ncbi:MAG: dTMP kinase [Rickettsiales bacterium]|jgi:dTMP kinase
MNKFITFEGVEGSGKSTQTKMLKEYFEVQKIPAILTREPGGTKVAEEIREILVKGNVDKMDGICEALLNFAARRNHIEKLIKPALKKGEIVICDRFFDSTIAYQSFGQNVDLKAIQNIQKIAIADFSPDITFLIDIDIEVSFERIKLREDNNRYEKMDRNFHQKVRDGFLQIAGDNLKRMVIIDGNQSAEKIHQEILSRIKSN